MKPLSSMMLTTLRLLSRPDTIAFNQRGPDCDIRFYLPNCTACSVQIRRLIHRGLAETFQYAELGVCARISSKGRQYLNEL